MSTAVILAVGQDNLVLNTRSAVLRSAGYVVRSASAAKQAFDQFLEGDFDMVILCHSIPVEERQRLTQLIRASGSHVPVLYITPIDGSGTDDLVDGILGNSPDALLHGVELALNHTIARFGTSAASNMDPSAGEASSISGNNSQNAYDSIKPRT